MPDETKWPAEVVEAVAQSLHGCDAYLDAIAALSALSPAAAAVIRGEAVAVPRKEVEVVRERLRRSKEMPLTARIVDCWLTASPYDEKEPTP